MSLEERRQEQWALLVWEKTGDEEGVPTTKGGQRLRKRNSEKKSAFSWDVYTVLRSFIVVECWVQSGRICREVLYVCSERSVQRVLELF